MLPSLKFKQIYRFNRNARLLSLHHINATRDQYQDDGRNAKSAEEFRDIPVKVRSSSSSSRTRNDFEAANKQDSSFKFPKMSFDEKEDSAIPLYKHHIPTNSFQKSVLSVGAAAAALLDPRRADMVAVLGETTGYPALGRLFSRMIQDPEGSEILQAKPRINSTVINLKELSQLPEGTLGHAYIKFLNDNNVTPDSRLPVQFVDDAELAYIMQRYREGHDLFHTVLGMPTNMLGEVTVKWIEGIQTGLPMCVGGAIFGPLRFRPKQRQKYISTYLPWALRVGKNAKLLMNVYFEKRWEQSLTDLRQELGIEEPPV